MDIHIDDSAFIDLINAVTADEIAALESSVDDLESELSDKADEEYVDDLATDLRAEWQQEIESAIDNIESNSHALELDMIEDEINEIQRELICVDERQANVCEGIIRLEQQVAELELAFAALAQPGVIRRAYNRVLAMSRTINWYSPKL